MIALSRSYVAAVLQNLIKREEGQALVEYALILALVSVMAIGALQLVGTNVLGKLNDIATAL